MKTSYKQKFDQLYSLEPSQRIIDNVNVRIEHARILYVKRRAYAYSGLTIIALVALVPMIQYASTQATNSGLYSYISLFISDGSYMLSNFRISILSILESLPIMSTSFTLAIVLIATYAFKKSSAYIKTSRLLIA